MCAHCSCCRITWLLKLCWYIHRRHWHLNGHLMHRVYLFLPESHQNQFVSILSTTMSTRWCRCGCVEHTMLRWCWHRKVLRRLCKILQRQKLRMIFFIHSIMQCDMVWHLQSTSHRVISPSRFTVLITWVVKSKLLAMQSFMRSTTFRILSRTRFSLSVPMLKLRRHYLTLHSVAKWVASLCRSSWPTVACAISMRARHCLTICSPLSQVVSVSPTS